ncbi:hypothetical protein CDAR_281921 [Caerostris darwini]|uniref:Uncharacterized protein n=1 Tax=Caerostris darwini TaxID=1538125 RepID=A0AAV4WS56_9ARAC|nr:hypothetical protein CDAR_281921 [Caerostris darwini]
MVPKVRALANWLSGRRNPEKTVRMVHSAWTKVQLMDQCTTNGTKVHSGWTKVQLMDQGSLRTDQDTLWMHQGTTNGPRFTPDGSKYTLDLQCYN